MKQPGDQTKLRVLWWDGEPPNAGDQLVTSTGRRYYIMDVRGSALVCIVLSKDDPVSGRVFEWTWGRRERRLKPAPPSGTHAPVHSPSE